MTDSYGNSNERSQNEIFTDCSNNQNTEINLYRGNEHEILTNFYRIGKALTEEKDTLKLFNLILESSIDITSSDASTIYIAVDAQSGKWSAIRDSSFDNYLLKFVIATNRSIDVPFEGTTSPITSGSIFGYTIITGKPLRIDDAYNIDKSCGYSHNKSFDMLSGYKTRSILSVPMYGRDRSITGVIQLVNKKRNKNERIDYSDNSYKQKIIPFDKNDELLMDSLAGQAAVALENNILYNEMQELLTNLQKQNDQLNFLTRKVLKAHEEERKRIARDIHDGPAQLSASLALKLEICKKYYQIGKYKKMTEEMDTLSKSIKETVREIRTIIYDLRPSFLEEGVKNAIKSRLETFRESTGMDISFASEGNDKILEYYMSSTIYRIVQEALSNIARHSGAKNVSISLKFDDNNAYLAIKDDGKGFDLNEVSTRKRQDMDGGFGLEGIKERVELVNGQVVIDSSPNKGTFIDVLIPIK